MLPPSKIASKRNHNKEINGHGHGQQKNGSKAINEKKSSKRECACKWVSGNFTKDHKEARFVINHSTHCAKWERLTLWEEMRISYIPSIPNISKQQKLGWFQAKMTPEDKKKVSSNMLKLKLMQVIRWSSQDDK